MALASLKAEPNSRQRSAAWDIVASAARIRRERKGRIPETDHAVHESVNRNFHPNAILTTMGRLAFECGMSRTLVAGLLVALAGPAFATFPYPSPPPGTPPQRYAAYLRLPVTDPPTRPNDFTG